MIPEGTACTEGGGAGITMDDMTLGGGTLGGGTLDRVTIMGCEPAIGMILDG